MLLHVFGGLFGVMTSWVLHRKRLKPEHEKEKTDRRTGLFAMLGTLFLWMFWPSFNSAVVHQNWERGLKFSVIYGTYLSLAVSVVIAMSVSMLSSSVLRALQFAVHHICVLLITLCLSLVMGMATGLCLKWTFWRPQQDRKCFDDQAFWEFPNLVVQK